MSDNLLNTGADSFGHLGVDSEGDEFLKEDPGVRRPHSPLGCAWEARRATKEPGDQREDAEVIGVRGAIPPPFLLPQTPSE